MATTNNDTKLDVCLVGVGGVGTITSYVLEKSGRARVTAVLRSNYHIVKDQGVDIDSVDHGEVRGFKPTHGKSDEFLVVHASRITHQSIAFP